MESTPRQRWFAVMLNVFFMGGAVWCRCNTDGMDIPDGHYKLTNGLQFNSKLIYQCNENRYPYPDMSHTCDYNGRWRPSPRKYLRPRCRLVECPDPTVLENGNIIPLQEKYYAQNNITFTCESGYRPRGPAERTCLPNGKWSGKTFICSRDDVGNHCPDPGVPAGGIRSGQTFNIRSEVQYFCDDNLVLVGSETRVCKEGGQWTGTEPACYHKHTYDSKKDVSEEFGSSLKQTLTVLDTSGNEQSERKLTIPKNGTLNIFIAMDISDSITPEEINKAKEAIATLVDKISIFSVNPNYDIVLFAAEVHVISDITDFYGDQDRTLEATIEKLRNYEVKAGSNSWTNLDSVFKRFLERITIIKLQTGKKFDQHYHAIIVFTDGAFNRGEFPGPTVERIKNAVYRNHTGKIDMEKRKEHLDIYMFGIGTKIFDRDLQRLVVGTGGRHYFRLPDPEDLDDIFEEIIDDSQVLGLCGLHKMISFTDDQQRRYPWQAKITIVRQGDRAPTKCLGSLISPEFVLTAAHCFEDEDTPDIVQVDINDGDKKVKKVEDFILHPKYNVKLKINSGVREYYDYDVALVKLEKEVKISMDVRPICIPCTKETNNALHLGADASCSDQEQKLLKDHFEDLNFLTKGSIVEVKNVKAKLGSNRDECIRHALQADGVTTRDVSEVVTNNFLCTGGRDPEIDHIACKGDSGGAVFKEYNQRTIQIGTVSWGTQNLCDGDGGLVDSSDDSRDFHINLFRIVPFLKDNIGDLDTFEYTPIRFVDNLN